LLPKVSVSELSEAEEEQRTENPCVPGSIPGGTTLNKQNPDFETKSGFFVFIKHTKSGNNKCISPCQAM